MCRAYIKLAKPGIVVGNLVSAFGGVMLASHGPVNWSKTLLVLLSIVLVVASGCAINNVVDRDIDARMARTRNRPLVTGSISIPAALLFASALGLGGFALLYAVTQQTLSVYLLLVGYLAYVGLYTLWLKRRSVHGTLAGSISGAMPPVVGYCAMRGEFDLGALTLLAMFSLWQMPHSYAIAIYRASDYRAASIPVLPVVRGEYVAKDQILAYVIAFMGAASLLTIFGIAGDLYFVALWVSGGYWLWLAIKGPKFPDSEAWARRVFTSSIVVVLVLSITMSIDGAHLK